jgi:hypothetical protein
MNKKIITPEDLLDAKCPNCDTLVELLVKLYRSKF